MPVPPTTASELSSLETDPSDVYHDIASKFSGIVIVDARTGETSARDTYLEPSTWPRRTIDFTTHLCRETRSQVTYCDGIYCDVSTKAAAKLSALGFKVKEMLDGKEGYPVKETVMKMTIPASQ